MSIERSLGFCALDTSKSQQTCVILSQFIHKSKYTIIMFYLQSVRYVATVLIVAFPPFAIYLQEAEARGEDYDRLKLLNVSAEEAERWEQKKKKKNPDQGFSGVYV